MSISSYDGADLPAAKGADRRVHQRRTIRPRLYVLLDGSGSDGILNDASEGGIALDMVGSEPPGDFVDVHFEMLELGRHFEAKGRVSWRDESAKKIGVTFVDLPEPARQQIREWLALKAAAARRAAILAADRAGAAHAAPTTKPEIPAASPVETSPAAPLVQPPTKNQSDAATPANAETPDNEKGGQLVQNLIDSFNTAAKKPDSKYAHAVAAWKLHSSGWNVDSGFFSTWGYWRWVAVGAVAGLAVLLAIGVTAHRLPWGNSASISVSKVGQSPSSAAPSPQDHSAENVQHGSGAGYPAGAEIRSDQRLNNITNDVNGAPNSVTSPPTPPSALASSLLKANQGPCINLGPNSGKIRIYLWSEKDTPQAIVATYARNLRAVQDVQLVDKAPYDLVLYVNGAQVNAGGSEAGFMWSSRVFRPWYCGQSLGLLEQTQINESLHYVQGANLDQRIQAEVAFLILHTFESIRSEHQK